MELPVIKDIGEGFVLAAHKNGPVICNSESMASLTFCAYEPRFQVEGEAYSFSDLSRLSSRTRVEDIELDDGGVPYSVRVAAIRAYVEFSWAFAKDQIQK
jgi:hypothetical protein